jgi:uncharacterized membrane protein YGL010W
LDLCSFNFFTIVGFISLIPAPHFCAAYFGCISLASIIALILVSIFYARLSWIISIIMLFVMLLMEHFAYAINIHFSNSWIIYLSIFVITWIFQFIGHKIEGKNRVFKRFTISIANLVTSFRIKENWH